MAKEIVQNPLKVFIDETPEVSHGFDTLMKSISATKGLDTKTKQLIYIGIQAALGDVEPIKFLVPMAKEAGATREAVKDAILLTLTICGLKGVISCLPTAMKVYDEYPVD